MATMHWVNKTSLVFATLIAIVYATLWLLDSANPEDGPNLVPSKTNTITPTIRDSKKTVNSLLNLYVTDTNHQAKEENGLELNAGSEMPSGQASESSSTDLTRLESQIDFTIRAIERLEIDYNRAPNDSISSELSRYQQQLETLESEYSSLSESIH